MPKAEEMQNDEVQNEEQTAEEALTEKVEAGQDNEVAEPANDPVLGEGKEVDDHIVSAQADASANHAAEQAVNNG